MWKNLSDLTLIIVFFSLNGVFLYQIIENERIG